MELHWAISCMSNFKLIRNLMENDLELHWAISLFSYQKWNENLIENDLELHWAIRFILKLKFGFEIYMKMLWSSAGPIPSFFHLN